MKPIRAWPFAIMTVIALVVVVAALVAYSARKPRLRTPVDSLADETAVPATPASARPPSSDSGR